MCDRDTIQFMFTVWMFTFVAASRGSLYDSIAFLFITSTPPLPGVKYSDEYVRLSVRSRNSKTTRPNCLCILPDVAVARSSSDGVGIRYVLPVLWMTSCFHAMGPMGQNQARRYVYKKFARWQYQLDSAFGQVHQNAVRGPEGRSPLSTIELFSSV